MYSMDIIIVRVFEEVRGGVRQRKEEDENWVVNGGGMDRWGGRFYPGKLENPRDWRSVTILLRLASRIPITRTAV